MALNNIKSINAKSYDSFLANIKHYFHKIKFDAIITKEDGSTEIMDLSDVIASFKIFKLHNAFVFPVIAVLLSLTPEQHIRIADNMEKTKFRLNLEKLQVTDISDPSKVNEKTSEIVYKDLMLELSDYDKARFRDESEQYNGGFEDAVKINIYMELFKSEHLIINKKPINGIFNNVKMDNMLIHLLSKAKQKILIQNSNRTDPVNQIVLPGKNLVQTIYYLQEVYGIYQSGIRLFFDFDRAYCLTHDIKDNPPVSEGEPLEYTNVICYVGKSSTEESGCYLDENTKTYYLLMPNSDQLTFSDKSAKDIYGNKLVFQSNTQEKKTVNRNTLENTYAVENKSTKDTVLKTNTVTKDISYTIKSGDTMTQIANSNNMSVAELASYNGIKDPNLIYTNQTIKVPVTTMEPTEETITLSEVQSGVASDENEEKLKYYFNNYTNSYVEDEFLALIARNELKYLGDLKDIDTSFITMNKTIYLSFLDESYADYNGMYELESLATAFTKIGKNMYETDTICVFARLTKEFLSYS